MDTRIGDCGRDNPGRVGFGRGFLGSFWSNVLNDFLDQIFRRFTRGNRDGELAELDQYILRDIGADEETMKRKREEDMFGRTQDGK